MEHTEGLQTAIRRVTARVSRYSPNDAEDLVQEALARAIRHGVAPDAEAWLTTVARRVAIDRARRSRELASGDATDLETIRPSGEGNPEDLVLLSEKREAVRAALQTLPKRYRDALVLYLEEDGSAAGVAKRLGLSPNAAWTLLSRARTRLRAELEKVGVAPALLWARFKTSRWHNQIATGGAVAAAAAAIVLAPSVRAPQPEAPVERIVTAPSSAPAVEVKTSAPAPAVVGAAPAAEPVSVATEETLDKETTPARYKAGACVKTEGGQLEVVSVEVWNTDPQQDRLTGHILRALPEPLRYQEAGCAK